MTRTGFVIGLTALLAACGDSGTTTTADSAVADAPENPIDSAVPDVDPLAPDVDPLAPDAEPPTIDAEIPDAVPPPIDAEPASVPPVISLIAWAPTGPPCTTGIPGLYTITLTVTDADTPLPSLTYSGSVLSCGIINSNPDTVTCPNLSPYPGTMTAMDPEGNSDSISFTIVPCTAGSATP